MANEFPKTKPNVNNMEPPYIIEIINIFLRSQTQYHKYTKLSGKNIFGFFFMCVSFLLFLSFLFAILVPFTGHIYKYQIQCKVIDQFSVQSELKWFDAICFGNPQYTKRSTRDEHFSIAHNWIKCTN